MKLKAIYETFMMAKIKDALSSNGYFNRPIATTSDPPYEPSTGMEQQNIGMSQRPTGIPRKPRHRSFFGLERRPGTIRL